MLDLNFLSTAGFGLHSYGIVLSAISILVYLSFIRYRVGPRDVPGPFWASILPFDRLMTAFTGQQQKSQIKYHKRYGPLVRVGPNHVSISDADAIPQIYGTASTKYEKSDFYAMFDAKTTAGFIPTTFSIRSEAEHKKLKRPVANAFSMSSLLELEPMTDACIKILEEKLDNMQGGAVDFGKWLHWYAFDVITSITFSNRMGFMEKEQDVHGIIDAIEGRLIYNTVIGQVPTVRWALFSNPVISYLAGFIPSLARMNSSHYIVEFAAQQLKRDQGIEKNEDDKKDLLARFRRSKDGKQTMSDSDLLGHTANNMYVQRP